MKNDIAIEVKLSEYKADTVRYAAYAVSGSAYVFLVPAGRDRVLVTLEPKPGRPGGAGLKKDFLRELGDERLRAAVTGRNGELRDFIVQRALSGAAPAPAAADSGLSEEQEKELDALIAEVEQEIKAETAGGKNRDPLGINKTWEEKHDKAGKKNSRR